MYVVSVCVVSTLEDAEIACLLFYIPISLTLRLEKYCSPNYEKIILPVCVKLSFCSAKRNISRSVQFSVLIKQGFCSS